MENNFLNDIIKQTEEFKKMKQEIDEGKMPDVRSAFEFLSKIPQQLEDQLEHLSEEEKEKLKPMLDKIKKESSIENILSKINAV